MKDFFRRLFGRAPMASRIVSEGLHACDCLSADIDALEAYHNDPAKLKEHVALAYSNLQDARSAFEQLDALRS